MEKIVTIPNNTSNERILVKQSGLATVDHVPARSLELNDDYICLLQYLPERDIAARDFDMGYGARSLNFHAAKFYSENPELFAELALSGDCDNEDEVYYYFFPGTLYLDFIRQDVPVYVCPCITFGPRGGVVLCFENPKSLFEKGKKIWVIMENE